MFFCFLKLDAVICTSLCHLLGVWGRGLIYSVTRSIIVLFYVRIVVFLTEQHFSYYYNTTGWLLSKNSLGPFMNSLELASLVTCWVCYNNTRKLGPRAIITMMPMKNTCSCLASNSFVLDASHCNGLKERSTY